MEEELELATIEEIQEMIYTIRGKQVMLDSDVANLKVRKKDVYE